MSKVILEFTLPDEREEYEDALKGGRYRGLLQELAQQLRAKDKCGDPAPKTWGEVREWFWQVASEHMNDYAIGGPPIRLIGTSRPGRP